MLKIKGGILSFLLLLTLNVAAKESPNQEQIKANLKKQLPELTIEQINTTPITGLFEIIAGGNIFYASADGRYVLSGDIIDLKEGQKNITENARKAERIKALNKLGEQNMIVFAPKDPKYEITVFTDIDCGYCRKFHSEIDKMNQMGIAVHYIAFPRTGLQGPTFEKMQSVWCAKDKKQALTDAKLDKFTEKNSCPSNAVKEGYDLGVKMGVRGTPTLILKDGTLFPGYLAPEKLLELLKKIHSQN